MRKANNDVLSGIRLTARLLKEGKLVICSPCRDAIREFGLYRWDTSGSGGDRVVKEHDHAMDDIRYFASTIAARKFRRLFHRQCGTDWILVYSSLWDRFRQYNREYLEKEENT